MAGLLQCQHCGFVTADLRISSEELAAIYGRDYFEGMIYSSYLDEESSLRKNFRNRLQDLRKWVPSPGSHSLFEVGCAYGYFLDEAQALFGRVAGIDVSAHAIQMAQARFNLDVSCGDFLAMHETRSYDIVCMWDTIEHLLRPDLFVAKVAEMVTKKGLFVINTGDIDSLNARLRGRNWRLIHPPYHMHYFSRQTLSVLLQRHGFDVIHVSYPATYRTLRMILYLSCNLRQDNSPVMIDFLNRLKFLDWNVPINLFDLMFVVARKRS
ncbi:MAG: class I SAM-dependent methyltransferase [Magnetococcus sp. YQC-5]